MSSNVASVGSGEVNVRDRRRSARVELRVPVYVAAGRVRAERYELVDVSTGGACIAGPRLAMGERAWVSVRVGGLGVKILQGRVVRVNPEARARGGVGARLGLAWDSISSDFADAVDRLAA